MPWYEEKPKETFYMPSPRCNAGMVVATAPKDFTQPDGPKVDIVIVYGGNCGVDNSPATAPSDEAFRYNPIERRWQKPEFQASSASQTIKGRISDADRPPALARHTMVLRTDKRSVVIFGGAGVGGKIYSDVYMFDAVRFVSKAIQTRGAPAMGVLSSEGRTCNPLYGHTAVVQDSNMWVFGGCTSPKTKSNEVWRLEMKTMTETWTWYNVEVSGERPPPTAWHTAICTPENSMVCVGGDLGSAVWVLGLAGESKFWSVVDTSGEQFPGLRAHASVCIGSFMYVFGGLSKSKHSNKNTYVLNLQTMSWEIDNSGGQVPVERVQHAVAVSNSKFYVFGGMDSRQDRFGDLYCFDARILQWNDLTIEGFNPAARCGHEAVVLGNKIYIIGGAGGGMAFADINEYNSVDHTWKPVDVKPSDEAPKVLLGHSAVVHNEMIYVFGGGTATPTGTKKAGNELRSFSPASGTWNLIKASGDIPGAVLGHRAAVWNDMMVVFGGFVDQAGYSSGVHTYAFGQDRGWVARRPGGSVPLGRVGHTFVIFRHYGIIFGGSAASVLDNTVHILNLKRWMWDSIYCGGSIPKARHSHAYTLVDISRDEARLWIFGGRTGVYGEGEVLGDLYCLQLCVMDERSESLWVWERPETQNNPRLCSGAALCAINQVLFLHGGDANGSFLQDMRQLNPANRIEKKPFERVVAKQQVHAVTKKAKQRPIIAQAETPKAQVQQQTTAPTKKSAKLFSPYSEFNAASGPADSTRPEIRQIINPQFPAADPDIELISSETRDVIKWLKAKGLGKYAEVFNINEIDLPSLVLLTDADLLSMGIETYGIRTQIVNTIRTLKDKYERHIVTSADVVHNPLATEIYMKTEKGRTYRMTKRHVINHTTCLELVDVASGKTFIGKTFKTEESLEQERNIRAELDPHYVVPVIEWFRDDTFTNVLVLEGSCMHLLDHLATWSPSGTERRMLFEQIARIVKSLHSQGRMMLHVDPTNFVFSAAGTPLLFDPTTLFFQRSEAVIYGPQELLATTALLIPPEIAVKSLSAVEIDDQLVASVKFSADLWGLGLILADMYQLSELVHGVKLSLRHKSAALEVDSEHLLNRIVDFDVSELDVECCDDTYALDLMTKLLAHNPKKRLAMDGILKHPYLSSCGESQLFFSMSDAVQQYESITKSLAPIIQIAQETMQLRGEYGGTRERLLTAEEIQKLKEEKALERQRKAEGRLGTTKGKQKP